jgi:hypothetical protein
VQLLIDVRVSPERITLSRMKKMELTNRLDYAVVPATLRLVTAYVALPLIKVKSYVGRSCAFTYLLPLELWIEAEKGFGNPN